MPESLNRRLKTLLHLLLARRSDPRQGPAVKRIDCRQNFETCLVMPKFARQFIQPLIRFSAAIAEKYFSRPNQLYNRFRQLPARPRVIQVRNMNELLRLLDQGFSDFGVGMTKNANGNAAAKIHIPPPPNIPKITPRSMRKGQRKPPVG